MLNIMTTETFTQSCIESSMVVFSLSEYMHENLFNHARKGSGVEKVKRCLQRDHTTSLFFFRYVLLF